MSDERQIMYDFIALNMKMNANVVETVRTLFVVFDSLVPEEARRRYDSLAGDRQDLLVRMRQVLGRFERE